MLHVDIITELSFFSFFNIRKFSADVDAEAVVTQDVPEAEQVDFRTVLKQPVSYSIFF